MITARVTHDKGMTWESGHREGRWTDRGDMVELDLTRPNACLEVGGSGVKNKSFLLWEAAAGEAVRTVVQ